MLKQPILNQLVKTIGSANWDQWQIIRFSYWDSVRLLSTGTNLVQFFTVPQGGVDPNSTLAKTLEDTNMTKTGSFGQVFYIISQIRILPILLDKSRQPTGISDSTTTIYQYYTGVANAFYQLMLGGVFRMAIGQKEYFTIPQPFKFCPPGFGPEVTQFATVGTATESKLVRPDNDEKNVFLVTPNQLIEPDQTFNARIEFPNANTPALTALVNGATPRINIMCCFDGYVVRPNQ